MKVVVVLPYIVREWLDACLEHCRLENVLLVDNTRTNRGVMRSHNLGVDYMRAEDADALAVLSAAIRFGPAGGLDFLDQLERLMPGYGVVNAAGTFGWHLIAFSRETVEAAGRWDENFSPYGFDDNDYAIRIHKAAAHVLWGGVPLDVTDAGMAHSIHLGGVRSDATAQLDYFARKWGHPPGAFFDQYHDQPFDNPDLAVGYWPPPVGVGATVDGAAWDRPLPADMLECERWSP